MKMNFESQPNNNNEQLPPLEEGVEVPPEVGSVAHIFNRIQKLREDLAGTRSSYERDVISRQIEKFTAEMNLLNDKAVAKQKSESKDTVYEIPEEHVREGNDLDDLKNVA